MIDSTGTVKIIDFGSTRVAGIMRRLLSKTIFWALAIYGTGIFFGRGWHISLLISFSWCDCLSNVDRQITIWHTVAEKRERKLLKENYGTIPCKRYHEIPVWIDETLRKAVHPDPYKRYEKYMSLCMTCAIRTSYS